MANNPANPGDLRSLVSKMSVIENKLDRLMNHLGLKNVVSPPVSNGGINQSIKGKNVNVKTKSNKK